MKYNMNFNDSFYTFSSIDDRIRLLKNPVPPSNNQNSHLTFFDECFFENSEFL